MCTVMLAHCSTLYTLSAHISKQSIEKGIVKIQMYIQHGVGGHLKGPHIADTSLELRDIGLPLRCK